MICQTHRVTTMSELSPKIQVLKARYEAHRARFLAEHPEQAQGAMRKSTHAPMAYTWMVDGMEPKANSMRYFKVVYCPACLTGRIYGFSYEVPVDKNYQALPRVKELGVQVIRDWKQQCKEKGIIPHVETLTNELTTI